MPRKYVPRKRVARKRRAPTRKRGIYRGPGFPRERIVNLPYVDNVPLTSTSGAIGKYVFRANSIFDPNQTAGGHQPLGHDQWMGLYNHYTVEASTISVELMVSSPLSYPTLCGVYLSDDTTTPTDAYLLQENGKGTVRCLTMSTADARAKFRVSFNRKRYFGPSVDNGNTSAPAGSNPSEVAFYTIWAQPGDGVSTANLFARVTISYRVRFYEPIDQAAS